MTATATPTSPAPTRAGGPSALRVVGTAGVAALAALVVGLWIGGGRPMPPPPGIPDAGALTGWLLPLSRTLADLAGVLTVGLLVLGGLLVPAREGVLTGARLSWTRAARWSALVWALAVAVEAVAQLSDVLAVPLGDALDAATLRSFLLDIDLGRALLVQFLLALIVAGYSVAVRTTTGAAVGSLLALAALVPPTLTGHSGSSAQHTVAVSSLMVHVVTMSLWCGGLVALVLLGTSDRRAFGTAVPRFSRLALWCAVGVVASGVANATVRMDALSELVTTAYGRVLLLKVLLVAVVAGFGLWHRRRILPSLAGEPTRLLFVRVAAVEVAVMAATIAMGVALSRTPPPVPALTDLTDASPARLVLGFDLPPSPDVAGMLWGQFRLDGFFTFWTLLLGALYLVGLRTLRRGGLPWPVGRTVSWYAGLALLWGCTNLGVATYSWVLFSVHMVQHMILTMLVPLFLVLGAPITLALQALPDVPGQVGPRQWLEAFVGSRFVRLVTHPVVAAFLYVSSFYLLYFTGLLPYLMQGHWGHVAMVVWFVLSAVVFYWVAVGIDPGPRRPPFLVRMLLMFFVIPLHSFFSVAVMMTTSVFAQEYFTSLQRPYFLDLLDDQHLGGSVGWALGDVPMALMIAVLFVQWTRADAREARALDEEQDAADAGDVRAEDRLAAYNAYLASLAARDRRDD